MVTAVLVAFIAIVGLMWVANRLQLAFPVVLVCGGIAIGFIPGIPTAPLPPELVLTVFLPPLLYWESLSAPTSEFRASAFGIFLLAVGLVIVTMLSVAVVAHWVIPGVAWGVAFVLGAIVSSTDEAAFFAIADRLNVPRHLSALVQGESLINDATSLIFYGAAIAAVTGASFSVPEATAHLLFSLVASLAIGVAAAGVALLGYKFVRDEASQAAISVCIPFISFLPAYHFGLSGVLATVTTGIVLSRFTLVVLEPNSRQLLFGFWVVLVFLINAFIFVEVGLRFHQIVLALGEYTPLQLTAWGLLIAAVCVVTRIAWTFAVAVFPTTRNRHERAETWSHAAILSWAGMRGGVSLAAAFAIPLEAAAGPFPLRDLIIFLTFCVLLATLVLQGVTLPLLITALNVHDDGATPREERLALAHMARAALNRLTEIRRAGSIPNEILELHRQRLQARLEEFDSEISDPKAAARTAAYRQTTQLVIDSQRQGLQDLRRSGKIDNVVQRRLTRVLDMEAIEMEILEATGRDTIDE